MTQARGYNRTNAPKKSGGKLIIIALLVLVGLGVGVAVIGKDKAMAIVGLTPSLKSQVIGTWQADEGYTITFTSDTYTGKDGIPRPYTWQEGSFEKRSFGKADVLSGNFEIDGGQVKVTPRAVLGGGGNSLRIVIGDKTFSYQRSVAGGASPAKEVAADVPAKEVAADVPAKEVDLRKIIALQKDRALTDLQKESQAEALSGFVAVTGKIASSMRSPSDKSRLQIFVGPSDVDHTRSIGIAAVRCDVSDYSKEIMAAAPGTPVRITGQAKYEPDMMGFVIRNSKAELIDAATAGGAVAAEATDPIQRARAKGRAIGLEMVASEEKTKALLVDAVEAERAGNTTRLRAIKSEINQLLSEKSAREKVAMEYVGGLNQAERDAYIEGIQAAQAGK